MARVFDLIDSSGVLPTVSLISMSGITAPPDGYGSVTLNARHLLGDDPTSSGRVLETYKLRLQASSHDNAAAQEQALLALLRKAARYGTDPRQTAPVYFKQQGLNETNPRYALCYGAYELVNPSLFGKVFERLSWIENFGLTLIREHPWRSGIPGVFPTATTQAATDGPASPTTVHLASLRDSSLINHIYRYDDSAATFSANLAGTASFALFPAVPAINDILYVGSSLACPHNIVINLATAGVYVATIMPEIWTGAAWVAPAVGTEWIAWPTYVTSSLFKAMGDTTFNIFTKTGWTFNPINAVDAFWVRFRISAFTSMGTNPVTGVAPPYAVRANYIELPSTALAGDMPATVMLRLTAPEFALGSTCGPDATSRIILGSKSRNLDTGAASFSAQIDVGTIDLGTLSGWAASYGPDSAMAWGTDAPSYRYVNVTFATDSTLVMRVRFWGTTKADDWMGRYRCFIMARQVGGAAGDVSVRLRTRLLSLDPYPFFDSPTVALKAVSPIGWEVVDVGTLQIPFFRPIYNDVAAQDLIFDILASRSTGASTLRIAALTLIPIDEWFCVVDDPVSNVATGNSALRGAQSGVGGLDIDGGIMRRGAIKVSYNVLEEHWLMNGPPPSLESGLKTRIYMIQMHYPTAWGAGPMQTCMGKLLSATVYAHNRYSALRGAG